MKGETFKILFHKDKGYLSNECQLDLEQLSLSEYGRIFKDPAFWQVKILNHIENENKLYLEILSYEIGETEFTYLPEYRLQKINAIKKVTFKSINTVGLFMTFNGGNTQKYSHPIDKEYQRNDSKFSTSDFSSQYALNTNFTSSVKNTEKVEQVKRVIKEQFFVSLKNVKFKLGCVCVEKKIVGFTKIIKFDIINHEIRDEFDAVKNYFANALKTKRIEVFVEVELINEEISSKIARSKEIDKIDKELIETIKFEFVQNFKKSKIDVEISKSIFTADQYFDKFPDDKFISNTFFTNDKNLFDNIIEISNSKHYKNLRYLSSIHCHEIMKLRFILKPFSFIFLIEGSRNYHIIWETLDTQEATYIWRTEKNKNILKLKIRKLEDTINTIRNLGKTAYINTNEDNLQRIYHDYSEIVDGFVKWKGELESYMT